MSIEELLARPDLLEVARRAVEDVLIEFRDARISVMRNNGLVVREADGRDSHIIRMGIEQAIAVGLRAVITTASKGE